MKKDSDKFKAKELKLETKAPKPSLPLSHANKGKK
jgi:hypothetical protein